MAISGHTFLACALCGSRPAHPTVTLFRFPLRRGGTLELLAGEKIVWDGRFVVWMDDAPLRRGDGCGGDGARSDGATAAAGDGDGCGSDGGNDDTDRTNSAPLPGQSGTTEWVGTLGVGTVSVRHFAHDAARTLRKAMPKFKAPSFVTRSWPVVECNGRVVAVPGAGWQAADFAPKVHCLWIGDKEQRLA